MKRGRIFNRETDVREVPSYGIMEAAHYLRIPPTTVRCWVAGRYYPSKAGRAVLETNHPPAGPP